MNPDLSFFFVFLSFLSGGNGQTCVGFATWTASGWPTFRFWPTGPGFFDFVMLEKQASFHTSCMLHNCIHSDPRSASWAWYIMLWPAHCTTAPWRLQILGFYHVISDKKICFVKFAKRIGRAPKDTLFSRVFPLCFLSIHHSIHVFQPNKSPSLPTKHSEGIEVPCEPYGEKGVSDFFVFSSLQKMDITESHEGKARESTKDFMKKDCNSEQPWMIQWSADICCAGSRHPLKSSVDLEYLSFLWFSIWTILIILILNIWCYFPKVMDQFMNLLYISRLFWGFRTRCLPGHQCSKWRRETCRCFTPSSFTCRGGRRNSCRYVVLYVFVLKQMKSLW